MPTKKVEAKESKKTSKASVAEKSAAAVKDEVATGPTNKATTKAGKHSAKAQAEADELALADFLYDDSDWRLAVANDDTRLGRDEWKVAQVHERMNEDE